MVQYGQSDDGALERYLRALEARIRALETSAPLRNAAISDGGQLVVKGVDGRTLVLMGRSDDPTYEAPDGHKQMVFQIYREDGALAFEMADPLPAVDGFYQYFAFYDRSGNEILSDDTTSGQGLSRPYVPAVFTDYPAAPTQVTTSGSFTTIQRCSAYVKQHPKIVVGFLAQTATGTPAEVRLWDATHGVQIGPTVAVPAFTFQGYNIGPVPLVGAHMEGVDIDLQIRRTAGAGSVGAYVTTAYGVQS